MSLAEHIKLLGEATDEDRDMFLTYLLGVAWPTIECQVQ